jgi:hypothetical protein
MALRILAANRSRPSAPSAPWLQRQCACGTCAACRKKTEAAGTRERPRIPPIVRDVLRSPGHPLDAATRSSFESRFGHDFGRVRVHADGAAARSAQAVDATAYTVGTHVVFGAGRYAPGTGAGQRLLAHELAHVVQQSASSASDVSRTAEIGPANHPLEREADLAADGVTAVRPTPAAATPGLQRQGDPAQAADDCSGYEVDPVSFSLHVAKTYIDPKLAAEGDMPVCEPPRGSDVHSTDCEVPFKNGPPTQVRAFPATTLHSIAAVNRAG